MLFVGLKKLLDLLVTSLKQLLNCWVTLVDELLDCCRPPWMLLALADDQWG